jgi:hypothetical protein
LTFGSASYEKFCDKPESQWPKSQGKRDVIKTCCDSQIEKTVDGCMRGAIVSRMVMEEGVLGRECYYYKRYLEWKKENAKK